jgi:hypothetical protein
MKPRRFRSNSTSRYAGVCDATSLDEALRVVRAINLRVKHERSLASSAAREKYLRSLMGLPAVPSTDERRSEGPG